MWRRLLDALRSKQTNIREAAQIIRPSPPQNSASSSAAASSAASEQPTQVQRKRRKQGATSTASAILTSSSSPSSSSIAASSSLTTINNSRSLRSLTPAEVKRRVEYLRASLIASQQTAYQQQLNRVKRAADHTTEHHAAEQRMNAAALVDFESRLDSLVSNYEVDRFSSVASMSVNAIEHAHTLPILPHHTIFTEKQTRIYVPIPRDESHHIVEVAVVAAIPTATLASDVTIDAHSSMVSTPESTLPSPSTLATNLATVAPSSSSSSSSTTSSDAISAHSSVSTDPLIASTGSPFIEESFAFDLFPPEARAIFDDNELSVEVNQLARTVIKTSIESDEPPIDSSVQQPTASQSPIPRQATEPTLSSASPPSSSVPRTTPSLHLDHIPPFSTIETGPASAQNHRVAPSLSHSSAASADSSNMHPTISAAVPHPTSANNVAKDVPFLALPSVEFTASKEEKLIGPTLTRPLPTQTQSRITGEIPIVTIVPAEVSPSATIPPSIALDASTINGASSAESIVPKRVSAPLTTPTAKKDDYTTDFVSLMGRFPTGTEPVFAPTKLPKPVRPQRQVYPTRTTLTDATRQRSNSPPTRPAVSSSASVTPHNTTFSWPTPAPVDYATLVKRLSRQHESEEKEPTAEELHSQLEDELDPFDPRNMFEEAPQLEVHFGKKKSMQRVKVEIMEEELTVNTKEREKKKERHTNDKRMRRGERTQSVESKHEQNLK